MERVEKDYEEFLRLLNKHGVRYCIVGAYAVAFHAIARFTKDMDICGAHKGKCLKAYKGP
jgi:hypothetical protein